MNVSCLRKIQLKEFLVIECRLFNKQNLLIFFIVLLQIFNDVLRPRLCVHRTSQKPLLMITEEDGRKKPEKEEASEPLSVQCVTC